MGRRPLPPPCEVPQSVVPSAGCGRQMLASFVMVHRAGRRLLASIASISLLARRPERGHGVDGRFRARGPRPVEGRLPDIPSGHPTVRCRTLTLEPSATNRSRARARARARAMHTGPVAETDLYNVPSYILIERISKSMSFRNGTRSMAPTTGDDGRRCLPGAKTGAPRLEHRPNASRTPPPVPGTST